MVSVANAKIQTTRPPESYFPANNSTVACPHRHLRGFPLAQHRTPLKGDRVASFITCAHRAYNSHSVCLDGNPEIIVSWSTFGSTFSPMSLIPKIFSESRIDLWLKIVNPCERGEKSNTKQEKEKLLLFNLHYIYRPLNHSLHGICSTLSICRERKCTDCRHK